MIGRKMTATAAAAILLVHGAAFAQTATGPCEVLAQYASNGAQARIAADDAGISAPKSVTTLSCLDNFFNGAGLNIITNLLDPTKLLQSVEGQICSAVQSTWQNLLGGSQCGLTLTGFNIGFFGGLGAGSFCPKLSFGAGGPPIGGISTGGTMSVTGTGTVPIGYSLPTSGGLW